MPGCNFMYTDSLPTQSMENNQKELLRI